MTDKHSAKTEDEILEQTFGGFDTQMTDFNTQMSEATEASGKQEKPAKKASLGSNKMLYIAGGVAAVGVIGYMGLKTMFAPAPTPIPQAKTPVREPAPDPVVENATQAEAPKVDDAVLNHLIGGVGAENKPPLTDAPNPVDAALNAVSPVEATPAVVEPTPAPAQVVEATPAPAPVVSQVVEPTPALVVVPTPVVTNNAQVSDARPVALVGEIKELFEQQNREFRTVLNAVDSRITTIERTLQKQEEINKNVESRLKALENRRVASAPAPRNNATGTVSTKKPVAQKPATKPIPAAAKVEAGEQLLIDNTNNRRTVVAPTSSAPQQTVVKIESGLTQFNVHSIYNGRSWLRNSDGSLSTYTVGDRLPNGELIKNVDSETFEITTDRRKFGK